MDVNYFASQEEFRDWLAENHDSAREIWVGFYKKGSGKAGISYPEAVDEALAYGWIDGIRKGVDGESYANRFTPRKPRSNWSAVNVRRVGELIELSRIQPAGIRAFEQRDMARSEVYSYENQIATLDPDYERRFRENAPSWSFFHAQPPSYRRVATWWVMSAKQEQTRLRRLTALIGVSERGQRLPNFSRPREQ
jgi:uncharacterized protein YdeI (YjbR/CyaY-like superfamily)